MRNLRNLFLFFNQHTGNALDKYWKAVYQSFNKQKNFNPLFIRWGNRVDKDFIKLMPSYLPYTYPVKHYDLPYAYQWDTVPDMYTALSTCMQPLCPIDPNPAECVIHFRCSDVPFIRHIDYHFYKYQYYKYCFEESERYWSVPVKKVIILISPDHNRAVALDIIKLYTEDLVDFIKKLGIAVCVSSGSLLDDFTSMANAKTLISIGSSLSFMAGLYSKSLVLHPVLPTMVNQQARWIRPNFSLVNVLNLMLPHHEVADYLDTQTVIKQLRADL